jgi:hypothetical protein
MEGIAASTPISRPLLEAILADQLSDRFVCELIWWRLGYRPGPGHSGQPPPSGPPDQVHPGQVSAVEPRDRAAAAIWQAGPATPQQWADAFPHAPELIAERPASVRLTRSIPPPFKQLLKSQLGFTGYRIGALYPRRTRRATAVNWLLADLASRGEELPSEGPLPPLLDPPADPAHGHPGDPPVR